ncbi:hypothetical protein [Pseudarthrobacter sp. fls2-241-R2A-127]|uniref:hypothetical protein n=1 Tax=Pseudarthrobacter sp. fls2-241-R2A-127 TaxID=3040303 RepID=UPI002555177A|nr:hypothetical protein [Pseudarthrobacter sp. fls2-241-R2A-127]
MPLFPRRLRQQNMLPGDAYPPERTTGAPMPARKRAAIDRKLRRMVKQHRLPAEPGEYLDTTGDRWTLDAQGGWTDAGGVHRDARYAPIIALFVHNSGPFTRIES